MPSRHDPVQALDDIIDNIRRLTGYVAGMERVGFEYNALVRDAVERCLERVCEAAHRLGDLAPVLMPDQPWADIRGMGNKLRHAYDNISVDIIWDTVRERLPSLEDAAREALERLKTQRGEA